MILHPHPSHPRTITAYKLLRLRRDGSIGPLFINKRQVIPLKRWLAAEDHPTKGYAHRPGWHAAPKPIAPHLSLIGRQWFMVHLRNWVLLPRPAIQGGAWYLAQSMKVVGAVTVVKDDAGKVIGWERPLVGSRG